MKLPPPLTFGMILGSGIRINGLTILLDNILLIIISLYLVRPNDMLYFVSGVFLRKRQDLLSFKLKRGSFWLGKLLAMLTENSLDCGH